MGYTLVALLWFKGNFTAGAIEKAAVSILRRELKSVPKKIIGINE
jgi:hypothetical protein